MSNRNSLESSKRPSPRHLQSSEPKFIDIESDEVLTLQDKAEIEEILADMLFEWWKKKKEFKK